MKIKHLVTLVAIAMGCTSMIAQDLSEEVRSIMFGNMIHMTDMQAAFSRRAGGLLPAKYIYADIDGDGACNELVLSSYDGTTQVAFDMDYREMSWRGHIADDEFNYWTPVAHMGMAAAYEPDEVILCHKPQFGALIDGKVCVLVEEEVYNPEGYDRMICNNRVLTIEFDPIASSKQSDGYRYMYNITEAGGAAALGGIDNYAPLIVAPHAMLAHLEPITFSAMNEPAALPAAAARRLAEYHPGFKVKETTRVAAAPDADLTVYTVEYEWTDTIALVSTVVVNGDLVLTRDDYATLHYNGDLTDDGKPMHVWSVFDCGYYSIPVVVAMFNSPNGPMLFTQQYGDACHINYILEYAPPMLQFVYYGVEPVAEN